MISPLAASFDRSRIWGQVVMRKGLAYLDMAEKCRDLASKVTKPQNKKQLEDMAKAWKTLAAKRAKQLATPRSAAKLGNE